MPSPTNSTSQRFASTVALLSELEALLPSLSAADQVEIREKFVQTFEAFSTGCHRAGLEVPGELASRAAALATSTTLSAIPTEPAC